MQYIHGNNYYRWESKIVQVLFACLWWSASFSALKVCSEEEGNEHNNHAHQRLVREHVGVDDAGDEDADGLSGCHDEREDERPKGCDGIEDEKLTDC